jgi:hypothetical protein
VAIESRIDIVVKNLNKLTDVSKSLQEIQKSNEQLVKGLNRVEKRLNSIGKKGSGIFSSMGSEANTAAKGVGGLANALGKMTRKAGGRQAGGGGGILSGILGGIGGTAAIGGMGYKAITDSINGMISGLRMSIAPATAFEKALYGVGDQLMAHPALYGGAAVALMALAGPLKNVAVSGLGKLAQALKRNGQELNGAFKAGIINNTKGLKDFKIAVVDAVTQMKNLVVGASLSELNMHVGNARKEMESFWHMTRGAEEAAEKLAIAMAAQRKEQAALNKLLLQAQGKSTASAAERAAHKTSAKYRQRQLDMGWNLGSYTDQEGQQQFMWRQASLDIAKKDVQLAEERLQAVLAEEKSRARSKKFREMSQRQERKNRKADINSRFRENLMLGVGFPMLFGGGVGAIAGGAGGAMLQRKMGTKGGFGAQILLSAAGQAFDSFVSQTIQSVTKLGQALTSVSGTFQMMTERSLFSSDATRIHAKNLLDQGKRTEAAALMTKELTKALGPMAVQDLKDLGEKSKQLAKDWGVLKTQMELLIVGPLADMIEMLNKVVSRETAKNKLSGVMQESERLGVGNSIDLALKDVMKEEISKLGNIGKLERLLNVPGEQEMVGGFGGIDVNALPTESILKLVEALDKYNKSIEQFSTASKGKGKGILPSPDENNEVFQSFEKIIQAQEKLNEKTKLEKEIANAVNKEARIEAKLKLAILDIEGKITEEQRKRLKEAIRAGEETEKVKVKWEDIRETIASGLTSAVEGLIAGTKSLGESLAGIAKSIANMYLQAAFMNMLPTNLKLAEGGYVANGIKPFASGGYATRPTVGLVGEAGEDEYIIPASKMAASMQRYSAGARGEAVIPGTGSSHVGGGGGASTTVNYSGPILNFNSEEFVPKSAVGQIIATATSQGARAGENRTLSTLRNSRSTRSRLGM